MAAFTQKTDQANSNRQFFK